MNRSQRRLIGGLAGVLLALSVVGAASAYWEQTPATITINGARGPIECGRTVTFRATVRDANGDRIAKGGPVTWSFASSPSAQDRIDPEQSTTRGNGVSMARVKFACVPGDRVIRVTAGEVSGTITVRVGTKHHDRDDRRAAVQGAISQPRGPSERASTASAVRATIELPRTSTAPDPWSSGILPSLIALIALLAGGGLILRHLAAPRH